MERYETAIAPIRAPEAIGLAQSRPCLQVNELPPQAVHFVNDGSSGNIGATIFPSDQQTAPKVLPLCSVPVRWGALHLGQVMMRETSVVPYGTECRPLP